MPRLLLAVPAAVIAWALWVGELFVINGERLSPFTWSALPISLLIAVVASYVLAEHAAWRGRVAFIATGSGLMLGAFVLARSVLWSVFEISLGPMRTPDIGAYLVVAAAGLVVSAGLVATATRWLAPLRGWTFAAVALALAAATPLSGVASTLIPATDVHPSDGRAIAFGYSDYWFVHALRLGYPVFWTTLLVPLALRLGLRAKPRSDENR